MIRISEEESENYRREAAEERYEREQQRKWEANASKHVLDPDREWEEDE